ncbi:MAG: hypothetical protein O2U61_05250, partial [Candidatus Bathyarchaeota archaeon]|nr:hypothetical protein [Candidatus Bathyarchaeota archaeon]
MKDIKNIRNRKYIALKEAAEITGYHPDYIGYLIRKGKIRAKKTYGSSAWLVYKGDILTYKHRKQKSEKRTKEKKSVNRLQELERFPRRMFFEISPPQKIKKIAKEEILGIKSYRSKRSQYFNIGYRVLISLIILFLIITSFTEFSLEAFGERELEKEIYSSNCTGTWQDPKNAQGLPDVFSDGTINSFSEGNSAAYKGGLGNLICKEFREANTENKDFQSAKIYFSFAIDEKGTDKLLLKGNNQISEGIIHQTERAPFWLRVFNFIARAQEDDASSKVPENLNGDNIDTKIVIWYSINGETWYTLDKISSLPLSNASNGGYLNYEVPFLKSWEDIEKLKIKFEGVVGGETNITAFLDSIWVKAKYIETKKVETKIISSKKHFKGYEDLEFKLEELVEKGLISRLFWRPKITKVTVFNYLKEKIDIPTEIEGSEIKILKPKDVRPGLYKLKIEYLESGELTILEQDFTWGVLAINPDKAMYKAGETSLMSIGVLDDKGQIVCDAKVVLTITDPVNKNPINTKSIQNKTKQISPINKLTNSSKTIKSTKDGSIVVSDTCRIKDVFNEPDYSTTYPTKTPGTYTLNLTAIHENGTYTITDTFQVETSPSFTIKRTGPTRVFPIKYQPMELEIAAYEDFEGEIIDRVPKGFQIKTEENAEISPTKTGEEIVWQKKIKKGEILSLFYTFKAPEEAPAFYLAGPAKIGDWQETRQWQFAIDQIYMYLFWDDFVGGAPTGWTLITTYDGRFPRGDPTSVTFGTTGGNPNHTPAVSGSVTQNDVVIDEIGAGAGIGTTAVTHSHSSLTCTPVADDNLPAYRSLGLIKSDSADPSTIPQGAIALFDADPDANWTKQSA